MTDLLWTPHTWEQIKADKRHKDPKFRVNVARSAPLQRVMHMDAFRRHLLMENPSKKQATKKGYKHEHGEHKSVNLLGKKLYEVEEETR